MEVSMQSAFLSSIEEKVLYSEVVKLKKRTCTLAITQQRMILNYCKSTKDCPWSDVIGAIILKPGKKHKKVHVVWYKKTAQTRKVKKFDLISEDPEKLVKYLQGMAYTFNLPEVYESSYIKKFKIIINPNSGRGLSRRIWAQVAGLFEVCEVSISYTERRNHATEIVNDLVLTDYDGLIVVSGDGLVHEVINAICKRDDGDLARMFPVSVIPAGSANALAQVICDKSGEKVTPENCAFIAIKGRSSPFDISLVRFASGSVVYSFLSVFWAFIADVDIGSENCRCCGACRFDLYGFWRVLALRRYSGTITWDDGEYTGNIIYFNACNTPYIGEGMNNAPNAQINDGMNDLILLGDVGRMALIRVLLRQDAGTHLNSPDLKYIKTKKWTLNPGTRPGILSIDGEVFNSEPIEVECLQNYATVFLL
jgi:YegS/Rv2252/BmrU family lipid kinase